MGDWLVFVHVLAAFAFMFGHGATAYAMLQMRKETDADRVRLLIDVSDLAQWVGMGGLLIMLVAGVWAGFVNDAWGQTWLWIALGIIIALYLFMSMFGRRYFEQVREASGAARFQGVRRIRPENPVVSEDLPQVIASGRPLLLFVVSLAGWGFVLYLMMFKPFS